MALNETMGDMIFLVMFNMYFFNLSWGNASGFQCSLLSSLGSGFCRRVPSQGRYCLVWGISSQGT